MNARRWFLICECQQDSDLYNVRTAPCPKPGKNITGWTAMEEHRVFLGQSVLHPGVSYTKDVRNKSKHANNCGLSRKRHVSVFVSFYGKSDPKALIDVLQVWPITPIVIP